MKKGKKYAAAEINLSVTGVELLEAEIMVRRRDWAAELERSDSECGGGEGERMFDLRG